MESLPHRDVLRALGDNTRYAIYLELARSPRPLVTSEIAETLGLHPNTVRPHLDRMREVGLLEVTADGRGDVGRPQHRYSLAGDAPSLGLEPPAFPVLARMLLRAASLGGATSEDAVDAGRETGDGLARTRQPRHHHDQVDVHTPEDHHVHRAMLPPSRGRDCPDAPAPIPRHDGPGPRPGARGNRLRRRRWFRRWGRFLGPTDGR